MRRLLLLLLLALPALGVPAVAARAGDGARVAWFSDLRAARAVAARTGRPIFVALHLRPRIASPEASARVARWAQAYARPEVVRLSRSFACVLRVQPAPEGRDPDVDPGAPAARHLILDPSGRRVLARLDADVPAGPDDLVALLRRGLRARGPLPAGAPPIGPELVRASQRPRPGGSPTHPVPLRSDVPGVRLRLRWGLPAPTLTGAAGRGVRARVSLRWDGAGPFLLEPTIDFPPAGEDVERAVDVRFDHVKGLAALATKGLHRVDLYLQPAPGSYPFSRGPLWVGRVWIALGDGGGAGGGGDASRDPPPRPPPPAPSPAPKPPAPTPQAPPPPAGPHRTSVVDPFVRKGAKVHKQDAVVAVEDPDAAVKPPRRVPLEQALRSFEKRQEREVGREGFTPRDRTFLLRYFERLREAAGGGGR